VCDQSSDNKYLDGTAESDCKSECPAHTAADELNFCAHKCDQKASRKYLDGDDTCLRNCPSWKQPNGDNVCTAICDQTGDSKFLDGQACVDACPDSKTADGNNVCVAPTAAPTEQSQLRDSNDDECDQGLEKDSNGDCVLACPDQNGNTRYYYATDDSCKDSCPSHMTRVGDNNVCECEEGKEENTNGDACVLICQDSNLAYLDGDECKAACPDGSQPGTNDVCGP
jgi:hypothetical protein